MAIRTVRLWNVTNDFYGLPLSCHCSLLAHLYSKTHAFDVFRIQQNAAIRMCSFTYIALSRAVFLQESKKRIVSLALSVLYCVH